jgi:cupin fold WbuC family metalloprotein
MSSFILAPGAPLAVVSPNDIHTLLLAAKSAPLRRARICLHTDPSDPIQEMVIAFCRDSYVQPHRHTGKTESFHVLRGTLEVIFFDDTGTIANRILLSGDDDSLPSIYRLRADLWHTVIVQTETAVLHEIASGPFRAGDTTMAGWAPSPQDTDAVLRFREQLAAC